MPSEFDNNMTLNNIAMEKVLVFFYCIISMCKVLIPTLVQDISSSVKLFCDKCQIMMQKQWLNIEKLEYVKGVET